MQPARCLRQARTVHRGLLFRIQHNYLRLWADWHGQDSYGARLDLWEMAEPNTSLVALPPPVLQLQLSIRRTSGKESQWGLIPRAGRFIWKIEAQQADPDAARFTEYRVSCSYLELYNESFDLLNTVRRCGAARTTEASTFARTKRRKACLCQGVTNCYRE